MGSDEEQYLSLLAEAMGDFNRKFEIHLALADLYFRDPDTQPKAIEQYDAALTLTLAVYMGRLDLYWTADRPGTDSI